MLATIDRIGRDANADAGVYVYDDNAAPAVTFTDALIKSDPAWIADRYERLAAFVDRMGPILAPPTPVPLNVRHEQAMALIREMANNFAAVPLVVAEAKEAASV